MNQLTTIIIVAVVVIVVAAIAVVVAMQQRKRHSEKLREQFGPEYERTVRDADDPRDAEKALEERRKRHRKLELRDLEAGEREQYRARWNHVQQAFVDDPGSAVNDADRLVAEIMSARGYPVDDFEQRAEDLSVEYPVVTQRYREALTISHAHSAGRAGTEDLRQAVTSYRALVDALLDDRDGGGRHTTGAGGTNAGGTNGAVAPGGPTGQGDADGPGGADPGYDTRRGTRA
ncbi:hypothetical protein WIS52_18495 [Pseudonocardia nematodicida]|uniref:Secreted protein n=1 Tax=Pseudonocardia nematodicida TaxID=1206997 RepID=A0ABV1KGL0_9PSEU